MTYLGDFARETTVTFPITTHAAAGGAVAPSSAFEAADLRIYKGSGATERASTSGVTMTSPFDGVTGLHMVSIDLSDDDDAGFFDLGNDYHVVLAPDETVDGQTVVAAVASFSIENRYHNGEMLSTTAGAITASSFAANAITAGVIADNAIDAGAIASGAITAAKFAAGAINAAALAADVIDDIWQGSALTEAYAADGAAATPAQLLYMIWAMLAERSVSSTTVTVKKLDGSTNAMTFTLNDASNPTSITRAG